MDAITSVLAKELAPRKIRVNAVNPGMIVTEGVKAAGFDQGEMRQWVEATTPLGRVGKAEEIAAVVAFLASDGASYVTGETLHVTGGSALARATAITSPSSRARCGIRSCRDRDQRRRDRGPRRGQPGNP